MYVEDAGERPRPSGKPITAIISPNLSLLSPMVTMTWDDEVFP
jgi:hypothetical protein